MKEILLTQGLVALVDDEDFEWLNEHKWTASFEGRNQSKVYAVRWSKKNEFHKYGRKVKIRMHREILNLGPDPNGEGLVVDHIGLDDRPEHVPNSLDNRKENLERITQKENMKRIGWDWDNPINRKKEEDEPFL